MLTHSELRRTVDETYRVSHEVNFGDELESTVATPDISVSENEGFMIVQLNPRNSYEPARLLRTLQILAPSLKKIILVHVTVNQHSQDLEHPFVRRGDSFFTKVEPVTSDTELYPAN